MQRMLNDAASFREEMIDGYATANRRFLRRVPGASGVIARGAPRAGRVSVVVGGGSGHYPAFYGLVGEGMATAAAIGDVFTSPSGEQAYRVAKATDGGAGILFTFGNYAGDVMNFGMAEGRLRAEGTDARTVLVTDDVLSAEPEEADRRRGIAGGFYVFKTAGASAARGDSLDTVEALTRHANDRIRTAGVAFAGCTIPGQTEPLFTVDPGRMEIGLGIHGEPGVRTAEQVPAREIAKLLVDTLLAEAPAGGGNEVAVLVNGLGGTKYEELFVLYSGVAPLLAEAGLAVHEAQIGEFVTALDMAGCSLTLFWLDDDLATLHDATASSPAYSRIGMDIERVGFLAGAATASGATESPTGTERGTEPTEPTEATEATVEAVGGVAGETARMALREALAAIRAAEAELGRLDAAAGDGDHGAGMVRGFTAASGAVEGFGGTARQSFVHGGTAFQNAAGGASGALVGAFLIAVGGALPASDEEVDARAYAAALAAGLAAIQRYGGAQPGDKTLIDTLAPFVGALGDAANGGLGLAETWAAALPAARAGMLATTRMTPKVGRASRLAERAVGFQDPGATSMYEVLAAFGRAFGAGAA